MKKEYPPIFEQGFKDIGFDELDEIFIKPFDNSESRRKILEAFINWLSELKTLGLKTEIWIDGSYATQKPTPQDIDIVIFINSKDMYNLSTDKQEKLNILTNVKLTDQQRKECICDVYIEFSDDPFGRKYWQKTFGSSLNKAPKGIVRMFI